ncbi:hypothetical protein EUBDOL_02257 [Amedibacillus dolichus DSM 3991]|uniref:Uncharacterized protein n=1 Tax=Amedibacillus dolichus DSM 3991 TaxID=428127 RepID=A8RFJ2_9FIRM|nr:hypothetical protein EUBDOL_02257 [Amedibacillus dolichus DSM 3991]
MFYHHSYYIKFLPLSVGIFILHDLKIKYEKWLCGSSDDDEWENACQSNQVLKKKS